MLFGAQRCEETNLYEQQKKRSIISSRVLSANKTQNKIKFDIYNIPSNVLLVDSYHITDTPFPLICKCSQFSSIYKNIFMKSIQVGFFQEPYIKLIPHLT